MELFRRGCVLCGSGTAALCPACGAGLVPPPTTSVRGVGAVPALFAYEGAGARLVQALKFRDGRRLVGPLADGLSDLVPTAPGDVVTWIPTSAARRRQRGFDQAELLAVALARRLDLPCRPLLRRRSGPSQTGRSRAERLQLTGLEARRRACRAVTGAVVVDDVCTTGATVRAARDALVAEGVGPVGVVVVARTP